MTLSTWFGCDPGRIDNTHKATVVHRGAQWINTSFMQLTTVVQVFENIVLCADDEGGSWDRTGEATEGL